LDDFPAEALRIYYLQSHYRSPLPWSGESLQEALAMLARLYDAKEMAESLGGQEDADTVAQQMGGEALQVLKLGRDFEKRFLAAMDSDFNTSQALGHLYELARAINRFARVKKARKRGAPIVAPALRAFELTQNALGLVCASTADFQREVKAKRLGAMGIDPTEIDTLIAQRAEARTNKDWAQADIIRDTLQSKNIVVMDTPEGVEWRVSFN
jgi:cysteinyl-tRNA synthetase